MLIHHDGKKVPETSYESGPFCFASQLVVNKVRNACKTEGGPRNKLHEPLAVTKLVIKLN